MESFKSDERSVSWIEADVLRIFVNVGIGLENLSIPKSLTLFMLTGDKMTIVLSSPHRATA